jgi:2-C-methyl-D-erythritol 4-phosphate cytidylyltransferase/2-C-methyl-D-erythritol 2,4-cyclodiphosphate synthase
VSQVRHVPGVDAVVVAAGSSTRFGGDKLFTPLLGVPLLTHALRSIAHAPVRRLVIVGRPGDMARLRQCARKAAVPAGIAVTFTSGGATRAESVRAGVMALCGEHAAEVLQAEDDRIILVHDGARPTFDRQLIRRLIRGLDTADVAVPAIPVVDSLRRSRAGVTTAIDRSDLFAVQTPQACRLSTLLTAYASLPMVDSYKDEASLVEAAGGSVMLVGGDANNVKVTTRSDLQRAEAAIVRGTRPVVGFGYDVHRFAAGRRLVLAGVDIPADFGLEGTSDADAVLHALMDALLGCAGRKDIGSLFPASDPESQGADSTVLLRRVLRERGVNVLLLTNVDVTIVAEVPRLAPYQDQMRRAIARALSVPLSRVDVKVTGNDGIGWIGRAEGIAAMCVVTALRH